MRSLKILFVIPWIVHAGKEILLKFQHAFFNMKNTSSLKIWKVHICKFNGFYYN